MTRAVARLRPIARAAGLPADGEVANAAARVAAFARVALIPLLLAAEALETRRSAPDLPLAEPALVAYVVFAVATLAFVLRAHRPVPLTPFAVADTLLLVLILLGEGGAPADMRFALSVPVLVAAFVAGPRLTSQLAVLSLAGFAAAAVVSPTFGHEAPARYVVVHTFDLAWRGALAVVLSVFLARRSARIRELAESRRSLVAQALGAEARARRELAYVLHDELVQGLLSAQQDIKRARRGHAEYLDRAEDGLAGAVAQLRTQILHLHPHQLESAGLGAALDAVAAGLPLADGSHPVVAVTSAAAAADADTEVLFAVGRELLTNAVRHAGAPPRGARARPSRPRGVDRARRGAGREPRDRERAGPRDAGARARAGRPGRRTARRGARPDRRPARQGARRRARGRRLTRHRSGDVQVSRSILTLL